jgi:curli biogenesis system outer membrane secretion channel CsgG
LRLSPDESPDGRKVRLSVDEEEQVMGSFLSSLRSNSAADAHRRAGEPLSGALYRRDRKRGDTHMRTKALLAGALASLLITSGGAMAAGPSSGQKMQRKGEANIPVCQRRLGTVAVVEPDTNWWQQLGLGSPEAVIKVFVMKSGCFGLVDRGKGLANRNIERALAESGELQQGSNIGRAQVKAADYFVVPDIVQQNSNSGGSNIGGALGGFLGHGFGAIAGGLSINKKEASVMLTLVNVRTTEQERMTQGYARKSDVSFGGGGGGGWWGGFAALGGGGYSNTAIGQVVVLAYLDAYIKLVQQMGGLPENASAAAPQAR